ncbi:AbrB family transcriptional regulator [Limimaricola pyoseonensis]|uniref:Ammonia monooxygenase n=1 Tax=Limimaricola pyoseonensis TaxID=521013 RepID=A0A1G7HK25_9RHOB|nr:AbrB family transcriptional regulator [Limimaricola pyoseonensis]SDF00721.1 hypothetical protein SAMN04488567_3190 [Limimaricola pyoseonensis]
MPAIHRIRPHLAAAGLGLGGAAVAALLGVPAGPLIGATLAVAAAAALRLRLAVAPRLRDLAFALIGVSLGAGVDADILAQLPAWSVSLALLAVALVATVLTGRLLLTRLFGHDGDTAVLASSPGTMSNAIAIALDGRGDATAVMALQLMRLLILVMLVPPLAIALDAPQAGTAPSPDMPLPMLAALVLLALGLGRLGARRGIPAACLLGGMLVSAGSHVSGLATGTAPGWAIFLGFAITGTVLGTRLSSVKPKALWSLSGAGAAVVATALGLSLGFAFIAHLLTGLPFGQLWVAYAPGGVEAMAAIGLALGYDPAFVAAHHFARILILVGLMPILLGKQSRKPAS